MESSRKGRKCPNPHNAHPPADCLIAPKLPLYTWHQLTPDLPQQAPLLTAALWLAPYQPRNAGQNITHQRVHGTRCVAAIYIYKLRCGPQQSLASCSQQQQALCTVQCHSQPATQPVLDAQQPPMNKPQRAGASPDTTQKSHPTPQRHCHQPQAQRRPAPIPR